jgi:hypothetical protein
VRIPRAYAASYLNNAAVSWPRVYIAEEVWPKLSVTGLLMHMEMIPQAV